MFGWIRQIMSGEQNPDIPKDATVKRDEQGRIAEVQVTLGDDTKVEDHPSPAPSNTFENDLKAASDSLVLANVALIQKGIGFEQSYEFSQDDNELILFLADGRKIFAEGEILGSFDPAAKSFMWAWANPSIPTDEHSVSTKLRALSEGSNESLLLEPTQSLTFTKIVELMAFARQTGNFDGVYRAMASGSVSFFIGYNVKAFITADGKTVSSETFAGQISTQQSAQAQVHCDAYDAEMLVIDKAYHRQGKTSEIGAYVERKAVIHAPYWKRDDNYWDPCSLGWPSDHAVEAYPVKFTGPANNQAVLIGRVAGLQRVIYQVEFFEDEPKITDQLIDWGDGFIWPQ